MRTIFAWPYAESGFRRLTNLVAPLCLVALLTTGCQTSPYKKGSALSNGLQQASLDVQNESQAIKNTVQALNGIVQEPSSDMRASYRSYVQTLQQLESAAARTGRTGESLYKKGNAHLAAWDKQMQSMSFEAVKNQSATRREAVSSSLQAVSQRYGEAAEAVGPLISYLHDIRRALDSDLTLEGVGAVKPIAANAQANADRVETALERLRKELDDLSHRLAPGQEVTPTASRRVAPAAPKTVSQTK